MLRARVLNQSTKRFYSSASTESLLKTPLYDIHVELKATMVPYAGFSMPVLYKDQTHIESHNWTRKNCGLFDVSHMLQHKISGPNTTDFLQKITPSDLHSLPEMTSTLSVLLNKDGGVIDDCIITKHGKDSFYIVTNAGCREKDVAFIKSELSNLADFSEINHSNFEGALLAIQGPKAAEIFQKYTSSNLNNFYFGTARFIGLNGFTNDKVHITRSGYTGEDGFEISIPQDSAAIEFARAILDEELVKPIGLAARDSLRLEAGMCLYGHELNEQTTPVESSLNWLVAKNRRDPSTATFNGSSKILSQIADAKSVSFKRVGIKSKGPSPREGNKIFSAEEPDKQVGVVCSGSPSPSIGGNVGQAFLNKPYNKTGSKILVEIRGKKRPAEVAKMPFVEPHYYKA